MVPPDIDSLLIRHKGNNFNFHPCRAVLYLTMRSIKINEHFNALIRYCVPSRFGNNIKFYAN